MGQYGSYNYESTESRALGQITKDSYNKDMAKNLIQLNANTDYMAQYMRKLQKGVDSANQNFIQQIQSLVNDLIVLIGGGTQTSIDFGDLKYIFQAIGALFGFDEQSGIGAIFPINLFNAAWHFVSTYVIPLDNFTDFLDAMVDGVLGTLIDLLGDIPIVGEGVVQLAAWITDVRDGMRGLGEEIAEFFDHLWGFFNFSPTPNDGDTSLADIIAAGTDFIARLLGIETNAITALGPTNPAIVALDGRIAALTAGPGSWTDNFNRTSIGSKYDIITGGSKIAFNSNAIGSAGSTPLRAAWLYNDEQFSTARNYAQWTIKIPFGYWGDLLCVSMSNDAMSNFVCVLVRIGLFGIGSGGIIMSGTSPSSVTDRGTYFYRQWKSSDVIGIGYDPTSKQYIAYVNNEPVDLWHDSGDIVNSSTNRRAGAVTGSDSFNAGAYIDEMAAYDWT